MADPLDQFEYMVGPGPQGWVSYAELLLILATWNQMPLEHGYPSLTISKQPKPVHPIH